ncbi:DAK2 domain-containing protein [Corynebacterium poyangense]|uniref:DAK2 domain-containing protein n=1 Tax=Corynebacterium poyangense TaxID=2684405 RepID=A0A7H0SM30_9CORY|nr:dihydroxyacetone kinase family protein [Corynebacterium poyangense]QNQ89605.1 DAK2 domain-containing protein [Corynebacterium poyangense]
MAKNSEIRSFLNEPDHFLPESLGGLVAATPSLRWDSRGFLHHKNSAVDKNSQPAVAVISGGGSGHEPLHAGFIGEGMLYAAVPGLMFTSPNAVQITEATRAADNGRGVVHIVKNYTGDVMNFHVAREHCQDIHTEFVLVDDDVATNTQDEDDGPGRRGTAATIFVEKVAGAAAWMGKNISEVSEVARWVAQNSRSMAAAMSPGHAPTTGNSTFDLPSGHMEVGVGIHGERGTDTQPATDAHTISANLLNAILEDLHLQPQEEVALLINGLGGTTSLELHLVFGQCLQLLEKQNIKVRRGLVGNFVTSVNMAGLSITLTRVTEEILELFDAPTTAPAWPQTIAHDPHYEVAKPEFGLEQPTQGVKNIPYTRFTQRVVEHIEELTDLDRQAGDGDFGHNMAAALRDLSLPLHGSDSDVAEFLSRRFLVRAGGTSGAVFGTLFHHLAQGSLTDACQAVQDLGGAKKGDRTVVDALQPAAEAEAAGKSAAEIIAASQKGAESTALLQAKKGRASYLGKRSQGIIDPGALVVSWLVEALYQH